MHPYCTKERKNAYLWRGVQGLTKQGDKKLSRCGMTMVFFTLTMVWITRTYIFIKAHLMVY